MTNKNKHIGSDFDDFLAEDGILEEVEAVAHKRLHAFVDAPAPLRKKDKRASIDKRPVDKVFEKT